MAVQQSYTETIEIQMLGGFRIAVGEAQVGDSSFRTRQLWNLLEYLIAFRHKTISNDELIGVLWPDESSENPSNALKNLVYRIRTIFREQNIPYARDLILSRHGCYGWNNSIPCRVDCEVFESLYKQAGKSDLTEAQKISFYQQAIALYKGGFLPNAGYEEWTVPMTAYYHGLYFKCVYALGELLLKTQQYEEAEALCNRALLIDQFEEQVHGMLITALMKQGKSQQALAHYNKITDLFYRELGVTPSEPIRSLYRQIAKTVNSIEMDLAVIKQDLAEAAHISGAYCCDYEVFRNMYRVEARSAVRTGKTVYIGLLTVTNQNGEVPEQSVLRRVMDQLCEVVTQGLRKGDVVSRFSATQFVLMLPSLTFENGQMVMERTIKQYRQKYRSDITQLHWKLLPLDPIL